MFILMILITYLDCRIFREKQYAERRLKDFDDALEREAEMCRQAKLEYAEETRMAQELHDRLAAERARNKYNKHYQTVSEILSEVVNFACKVGEYRELTEKLVPAKLFREWKDLFINGLPLFEVKEGEPTLEEIQKEQEIKNEKEKLLDEGDFMEYKNLIGEWLPIEGSEIPGPPKDNAVLGHIIQRLFNIVSPPEPPPPPPEFPPFPIKACFLGKFFSGKTTVISKLVEYHRLVRLSMDHLVAEAIEAHKNGEVIQEPEEATQEIPDQSSKRPSVSDQEGPKTDQEPSTVDVSRGVSAGSRAASTEALKDVQDSNRRGSQQDEQQDEKRDKTKDELEKEKDVEVSKTPSSEKDKVEPVKSSKGPKGPTPTVRAKLGSKAYGFLKKGKATPDQLIVDIMVEAVRNVPEGTGWLMDGFPASVSQAKLLEKSLTGYDEQKQIKDAKAAKEPGKVGKTKKSRLAPDPHPAAEQASPKSGIDLVILFDLPDEVALKRAEGRTYNPLTDEQHHQEYNPPPEGSYTGINKQEKVSPVIDPSNDREQVQQRITGFLDSWPKLDKWFTKFGVLKKIDADKTHDDLYDEAALLLNEAYQKQVAPPEEQASESASVPPSAAPDADAGVEAQTPSMEIFPGKSVAPTEGTASVAPSESGLKSDSKSEKGASKSKSAKSGSKPGSPKGGKKSSKKDRSPSPTASKKSPKSRSPSPTSKKGSGSRPSSKSPSPTKKGSRPGSKGSRPGSKRGSPKKQQEEEEKPPEPEGPPKPLPGSEEWDYVDQPLEKELADVLSKQWENVEDIYVDTCKTTFRKIRHERELIYRYFYGSRKDFVEFLKRPDEKQEYVLQWQKEYNDVAEDMRGDEDTKAEMHQRVDDLCDRLYEICDNRKEMAEKERQGIMSEGWLEDRMGVLTNHYISLMQSEVDRYQDTIRLLKDYYVGMEVPNGKVPGESINEYTRLPLVELPPTLRPQSASSRASDTAVNPTTVPEPKSPSGKKGTPKTPEPGEGEDDQKTRIPLVPRRPKSGDAGPGRGKDKKVAQKKGQTDQDKPETPVPPSDPDEKLIFDAYMLALTIIDTMASMDQADQEAEAQRQAELEREKEKEAMQKKAKEKKDKKGRKSPAKSPSKTETPPPAPPEETEGQSEEEKLKQQIREKSREEFLGSVAFEAPPEETEGQSEEEKLKQQIREKSREEFLGSVAFEDNGLKSRLEIIRLHASAVLQDLKVKSEVMYKDMEDWLGERFLQEVDSIQSMAASTRFAIEQEQRLQEEVVLEDKDFIVDLDIKTFKTPTPAPPPEEIELPTTDSFTVVQILNLCNQFIEAAPSGMISNRGFCDVVLDMANLTFGTESLPDIWMNITQQQLQDVCNLLSDSEFIDWRKFLLAAAQPWTSASKADLLLTQEQFRHVDQGGLGLVDQAQYAEVDMWFSRLPPNIDLANDIEVASAFERLANLKEAFFHIFAYQSSEAPLLDYNFMLMYFAVDSDPLEGFLRALSIAAGQAMPSVSDLSYFSQVEGGDAQPSSPSIEMNTLVRLDDLVTALQHSQNKIGDTHRLSFTSDLVDSFSRERLSAIFVELGADEDEALPFHVLYRHPIIQDFMQMCQLYKTVDLKAAFSSSVSDGSE
ncbi:Sperm flagellar protein 2 [Exaiptasia diaphana]|nr:Sperm flagellar protein 2 [Exaiptasia diaphana]